MDIGKLKKQVLFATRAEENWRGKECLNMIASENTMSPTAEQVYCSDFMHRYAEGLPYKRYYQGTVYADELETLCTELSQKLFKAAYAEVRPISGCVANLSLLTAIAGQQNKLIGPGVPAGSHISQESFGAAGIAGYKVVHYEYDYDKLEIDVAKSRKKILDEKPSVVALGGSVIPFPHPISELAEAAEKVGAKVWYDAAHVLGLIAGGQFQDPFKEGAEFITASTHKTFPGPQGGIILANTDKKTFQKIQFRVFPGLVSNHHLHRLPALAITLLETLKYGKQYAKQTVLNAKKLAQELYELGFDVLWEQKGFTQSHQVVVDIRKQGGGDYVANTLEQANIILNKNILPYDDVSNPSDPSGIRIGVQELTRYGMKQREMKTVADFMKQVLIDKKDPRKTGKQVAAFRKRYTKPKYCF